MVGEREAERDCVGELEGVGVMDGDTEGVSEPERVGDTDGVKVAVGEREPVCGGEPVGEPDQDGVSELLGVTLGV